MKTFFVTFGFFSSALLASAPGCAPTGNESSTSGLGGTARPNFGLIDGCDNAPAAFKDGVSFARLPNGKVARGFLIKAVTNASNFNFGAYAGYHQASDMSPLPIFVTLADLGEYGKGGIHGYPGVTVTPAKTEGRVKLYGSDGFWNKTAAMNWVKEGTDFSVFVEGKKIASGREIGSQYGKPHVLFWAIEETCFGVAAAPAAPVDTSGGAEMDSNGGFFVAWLGAPSNGQQEKGKQDDKPKFGGSTPPQAQHEPAGSLDPAPTKAPANAPTTAPTSPGEKATNPPI